MNQKVDQDIKDFLAATGRKDSEWEDFFRVSFNVKPTNTIPVLAESLSDDGEVVRHAHGAHWSLVPPWAKELKSRYPTFNARSEGLAEKRTWKAPLKHSRALIPASGYYEWLTEGKTKRPHYIHAPDDSVLRFAGLYSWWRATDQDEWILTATIITRPSTGPVATLHDRAPLILPTDAQAEWLDPGTEGDQTLVDAMVSAADETTESLEFHEVAPLRGDGPGLTDPV